MTRRGNVALLALLLLVSAACNRAAVEEPAPVETTETPSPTPSPTPAGFELEGVVLEASGSAQATAGTQSPSPGATTQTGSPSPSPGDTASPAITAEPPAGGEVPLFQNNSPGSIALRVNTFSGEGACVFNPNDTVVLSFTGNTTFEPADVTENERFPNNLRNATLRVTGVVLEPEAGCVLVARSINVTQASPSPTGRARTTRSPTPARTASPRPGPTPSPTATTPSPGGQGSPGAPGTPGA